MQVATRTTNPPSQAAFGPAVRIRAPIGAFLVSFPIESSTIISGIDQIKRNNNHKRMKPPPPFWATILGNRQMFPAPIATPIIDKINPSLDENTVFFLFINCSLFLG